MNISFSAKFVELFAEKGSELICDVICFFQSFSRKL